MDPLSDEPNVIVGSANFSNNSSKNNDENQLYNVGEKEVADVYLGEFMRKFDPYNFRVHLKALPARKYDLKAGVLCETDRWSESFFNGERDALRKAFFYSVGSVGM